MFAVRNMAYFKKLIILNLALLFVMIILLSMKVAATSRLPQYKIEPHHKACKQFDILNL
jgi:hypothetical protein